MKLITQGSTGAISWLAHLLVSFSAATSDIAWYIDSPAISHPLMAHANCSWPTLTCIRAGKAAGVALAQAADDAYWCKVREDNAKVHKIRLEKEAYDRSVADAFNKAGKYDIFIRDPPTCDMHVTNGIHYHVTNNNLFVAECTSAPVVPIYPPLTIGDERLGLPSQETLAKQEAIVRPTAAMILLLSALITIYTCYRILQCLFHYINTMFPANPPPPADPAPSSSPKSTQRDTTTQTEDTTPEPPRSPSCNTSLTLISSRIVEKAHAQIQEEEEARKPKFTFTLKNDNIQPSRQINEEEEGEDMFTYTPKKETTMKETHRTVKPARRREVTRRGAREPRRSFPFGLDMSGGSMFGETPAVTSSFTASPSTVELAGASLFPALPSAPMFASSSTASPITTSPSTTSPTTASISGKSLFPALPSGPKPASRSTTTSSSTTSSSTTSPSTAELSGASPFPSAPMLASRSTAASPPIAKFSGTSFFPALPTGPLPPLRLPPPPLPPNYLPPPHLPPSTQAHRSSPPSPLGQSAERRRT